MKRMKAGVLFWMLTLLICSSFAVCSADSAAGTGRMKGDLAGFDTESHSLILSTKNGFVTLSLGASTEIYRNGAFAMASELMIGERLDIRYDRSTMSAIRVNAGMGVMSGFITAIQARGDFVEQFIVTVAPEAGKPFALRLSPGTSILRDGIAVKAGDLAIGDSATGVYDPATLMVSKLTVTPIPPVVKGEIVAVQIPPAGASRQLFIIVASGPKLFKFLVNVNTRISLDGRPVSMSSLKQGHHVVVSYLPVKNIAVQIDATTRL